MCGGENEFVRARAPGGGLHYWARLEHGNGNVSPHLHVELARASGRRERSVKRGRSRRTTVRPHTSRTPSPTVPRPCTTRSRVSQAVSPSSSPIAQPSALRGLLLLRWTALPCPCPARTQTAASALLAAALSGGGSSKPASF